ncbi:discoidin domain-containing protein [Streptococcus suis]|nr:discoidin domain-containing protein [Streptococcus suis]MBM7269549.1 discoidin domain-containing protein [Streptococcus suis]
MVKHFSKRLVETFSIRKTCLGVGSVLICSSLLASLQGGQLVHAEQLESTGEALTPALALETDQELAHPVQGEQEEAVAVDSVVLQDESGSSSPDQEEKLADPTEPNFSQASAGERHWVNHAQGAQVVADNQENEFPASRAVDGIINRSAANLDQSRWGTEMGTDDRRLKLDLGSPKRVEEVAIYWERDNVTGFQLQASDDNQTYRTVYRKAGTEHVALDTRFQLEEAVEARYFKLLIDQYDGGQLNWPSVSLYEIELLGQAVLNNLAKGKSVQANGQEVANLSADKVTDGNGTTRWASDRGHSPKFIQIDLGQRETFSTITVDWERKNASNYRFQVSDDGQQWRDVLIRTQKPSDFKEIFSLSTSQTGRYLKLVIDQFDASGETKDGRQVTWDTVSVYEIEVFKEAVVVRQEESLRDIAARLEIPILTRDLTRWSLPQVPQGVEIEFIGADLEQILDRDLTIYRPLVDTTVSYNYRLRRGDQVYETPARVVLVEGLYRVEESDNAKLTVAPGLAEWKGHTGYFQALATSRIVVSEDDREALAYAVQSFKEDYEAITGRSIALVYGEAPQAGDFYFELNDRDPGLKKEGYLLTIGDHIKVEANQVTGAFWSTQTLLQLLNQNPDQIAKGIARDYPKYETRGFMLDVGRKPIQLSVLKDMIKALSWYKFNDFQLHLNDNYIWVEEYQREGNPYGAYSAFRLESDIKEGGNGGLNKADLTAKDVFYSKAEFKELIAFAKNRGIRIVPEFDAPAHALAFTKVRPDLTMTDRTVNRWVDHLEVSNPESLAFIKSVWDEYLTGEDPVFGETDTIHIGVDEFEGNNEAFRAFTDQLLRFAIDRGKTPRFWGSLTAKPGTTPVRVEGTEMNIWSTGWARPADMYQLGYSLINTLDGDLYIVPAAGYYADYLNAERLYNQWEVNKMGNTIIPAGSEQMKGAAFAIWNDMIDRRANGILEQDIYKRFEAVLPALTAKMWGNRDGGSYRQYLAAVEAIGKPANYNPHHQVNSLGETLLHYKFDLDNLEDFSGNNFDGSQEHAISFADGQAGRALRLAGGSSYFKTPLEKVGPQNSLSVWVKLDASAQGEQILMESGRDAIKLVQKETGKVGLSLEGYDHSFNYTLPRDQWVHLTFKGSIGMSQLYVNGELVDTLSRQATGGKQVSLTLPTAYIGSKEHAMTGLIDQLLVWQDKGLSSLRPARQNWLVSSDNENADGPISMAFDGDSTTIWHTQWQPAKKNLPATILIDMKEAQDLDHLNYLPRQTGNNGHITAYQLYGKLQESDDYQLLSQGNLPDTGQEKQIRFSPRTVRYLKMLVTDGHGGFGSAAELTPASTNYSQALKEKILEADAHLLLAAAYSPSSIEDLEQKVRSAKALLEDQASRQLVSEKIAELTEAIGNLSLKKAEPQVRLERREVLEEIAIPVEKISDDQLALGEEVIESQGRAGSIQKIFEDRYEDDVLVSSRLVDTVQTAAQAKRIRVGTGRVQLLARKGQLVDQLQALLATDRTSWKPWDEPTFQEKVASLRTQLEDPEVNLDQIEKELEKLILLLEKGARNQLPEGLTLPSLTIEYRKREIENKLSYPSLMEEDPNLPLGEKKVIQIGLEGFLNQHYEDVYVQGELVASRLVETSQQDPLPEIVAVGSQVPVRQKDEQVSPDMQVTAVSVPQLRDEQKPVFEQEADKQSSRKPVGSGETASQARLPETASKDQSIFALGLACGLVGIGLSCQKRRRHIR